MKFISLFVLSIICIIIGIKPNNNFVQQTVEITTGRGPSCLNTGLCGIAQHSTSEKTINYDLLAQLTRDEDSRILIKVHKENISVKQMEQLIDSESVILSKNIELPKAMLQKIGLPAGKQLNEGSYTVQETEEAFIITF